jgi:hypothetical protein
MYFGERHFQLLPFCEYVFGPGKSPVKVQPEILDSFLLRKVYIDHVDCWAGLSSCGDVSWADLDLLAFILNLFNHFCVSSRLICSFFEAVPGSLYVANTAV